VYVREINRLAAANDSAVRLVAFDRPGCHNPYLVCRVAAELVRDVPPALLCRGAFQGGWAPDDECDEPGADDALEAAIDAAMDLDLDDLVEVGVSIADAPDVECPATA
jgi:hypothetical protein